MVRELRCKLVKEKETRNYIVYSEIGTDYIGKLYVRREAFNGEDIPVTIQMAITLGNVPESP